MNTVLTLVSNVVLALPPITPTAPPGMDWLTKVIGWIAFVAGLACAVGFIIGATRLAISARGGEYEGGKGMIAALIAFGLIGAVSTIFGAVNAF